MSAEAERNKTKIPPQYELKPGIGPSLVGVTEPQSKAHVPTDMEKLYPGMRSPQSIVTEIANNPASIDATTAKAPETPEEEETAKLHPGMRSPDSVQAEQVADAINEKRSKETQNAMEKQRRIIRQYMEQQDAEMIAMFASRNSKQSQGHLTAEQIRFIVAGMKDGGNIQLDTPEENRRIIEEDEKDLQGEDGVMTSILGRINRFTKAEGASKEKKESPNPELLQKPLPVPEALAVKVDDKKVKELIESAKTQPTPELTADITYINDHLTDKTPAEILAQLKLGDYIKVEDLQMTTPDGPRVDPLKRDYLLEAVRLRNAAEAENKKASDKVTEEINTKYKSSKDSQLKIREAIKKNMNVIEDEAADVEFKKYVEAYKSRLAEEYKKATGSEQVVKSSVALRIQIAQEVVSQLHAVLPDITAEEFLAAVYIIESQANVQEATQVLHKKVFEQFNSGIQRKLIDTPLWIKIKREDIVSPSDLDNLIAAYNRDPTVALEQELAEYTRHSDNRKEAIAYYGLTGHIQPDDIRTDNIYELTAAVDNDRKNFFQNAIRLKHIVHDRLNEKVDSIVKAEFGSQPSSSMDAYHKLQAFITKDHPNASEDEKRLLVRYSTGFQEMVNEEIKKQSLIFKDQERVFFDIGKHKATRIPARIVLSNARKVAAEKYVKANHGELPEGITAEQFLAGMSVADTYRLAEEKLKEEVFEWYRKNKPRLNSAYNEGNDSPPRRRVPVPFLRRGQNLSGTGTPSETLPGPRPPTAPGNPSENTPPGGTPPPEPPAAPGSGGAAVGGTPPPDITPDAIPTNPDNDVTIDSYVISENEPLFDLTEQLPIIPIDFSELHSNFLFSNDEFMRQLSEYRSKYSQEFKEELKKSDPHEILVETRLIGKFSEDDVTNLNPKLLDALYIRAIIFEKIKENTKYEEIVEYGENKNPKFEETINIFDENRDLFVRLYTTFITRFNDFKNSPEYHNAPDKPTALYDERMLLAQELFNENESDIPEGMTQERLLAGLSVHESFDILAEQFFNELYPKIQGEQPNPSNRPDSPPLPEPPSQPPSPPSRPVADFEAFREVPTRREKRNIRKEIGTWIKDRINREGPISFEQSNGLLITSPNVVNVNTRGFINPDSFMERLHSVDTANRDRIIKNEIELRDLHDVVSKWGLEDLISEDYIEQDAERIRESPQLIDAIIIKSMAAELFNEEKNKQAIDAQLRQFLPKKTFEQYAAHKTVASELFPEFRREWATRLSELSKSLSYDTVKERDMVFIQAREDAAQKLFNEHLAEMPQHSSPEKLLAALSLRETYVQIQDTLFKDLYEIYQNWTPPNEDDDNNPPENPPTGGNPRYPSSGSGGSGSGSPDNRTGGPPPSNPPTSPGGVLASAVAEAPDVEAQVAAFLDEKKIDLSPVNPTEDIQKRLEQLAAGKN